MSFSVLKEIGDAQKKKAVVDIRSGDTVRVTQKIKEGNKLTIDGTGLLVTATTTDGVAEVVEIIDSAKGGEVKVRF